MAHADSNDLFEQNPTFCVLPWLNTSVHIDGVFARCPADSTQFTGNDYVGRKRPALRLPEGTVGCLAGSPYARTNPSAVLGLKDAFNAPALCATRAAMLRGEPVDACRTCYAREAASGSSHRRWSNAVFRPLGDWPALVEGTDREGRLAAAPAILDLRLGNACNLQCQMCSFPISSAWHRLTTSWHEAIIDPFTGDEGFWADLRAVAVDVKRVHVAGGEPFLQKSAIRLLECLVSTGAAGAIELAYTSNLTVFPERLIPFWPRFRRVEIAASCDGFGEVHERIRRGAVWDDFARNVVALKSHADVRLFVTVQRDNLPGLDRLFTWAHETRTAVDLSNMLTWPEEMCVQRLGVGELGRHVEHCERRAAQFAQAGNPSLATEIRALAAMLRQMMTAMA